MVQDLTKWIMADLNSFKISRACRQLGINKLVFNIDEQDLHNKKFLEIMLDAFTEVLDAINDRMRAESELPEYQFYGEYMAGDVWIEANIELNSLIDNIEELISLL